MKHVTSVSESTRRALSAACSSAPLSAEDAHVLAAVDAASVPAVLEAAAARRDRLFGRTLTFSPKVFLPLTNLCRNHCDYCSFRRSPGDAGEHTMSPTELRERFDEARLEGCVEALFCLGDTPETGFGAYRAQLRTWGQASTVDYLEWAGALALEYGLLPHTNAGILSREEMQRLARVNVSLGLMLENVSPRLCEKGMPHHKAPDKRPDKRLRMTREAGELRIPFTSGLLIGIGETVRERMDTLLAIRDLHREHGHIQEVIVQNFRARPMIPMASAPEPEDHEIALWVALARLVLDDDVSVQAPPNLNPASVGLLIAAGLNDFGGVSPVTPDFINMDHPWPQLEELYATCARAGHVLGPRLPIYERDLARPGFLHPELLAPVERAAARLSRVSCSADLARHVAPPPHTPGSAAERAPLDSLPGGL
ncbi:MAG: 7,8-didemethyl-8-hydroxy-5-deazariboflavin synthase CofG [Sandaracinaceae bacterium]|nr:7,8-didemethyl-8-hydroxy-5-deazariboflavin synthase CofG [Sandaracinaceae bacterium]